LDIDFSELSGIATRPSVPKVTTTLREPALQVGRDHIFDYPAGAPAPPPNIPPLAPKRRLLQDGPPPKAPAFEIFGERLGIQFTGETAAAKGVSTCQIFSGDHPLFTAGTAAKPASVLAPFGLRKLQHFPATEEFSRVIKS